MKLKFNVILLFLICFMPQAIRSANSLSINQKDGTTNSVLISEISKITFSDGNLVVNLNNGGSSPYLISSIANLKVADQSGVDSNTISNSAITLTVAHDYISVEGISNSTTAHIFTVNGSCVKSATIDNGDTIDISALPSGIYIVQISSSRLKFIKK